MYWPRTTLLGDVLGRPVGQGLEHLDLLVADGVGREVDRRLHRHQAEELHHVVLDHVADRAGGVVVAAPAAGHADLLGHRDLHRRDVPAVPDRLEDRVAEPQGQDVLDRLLAEVVVDPVDLVLVEDPRDVAVQRAGAGEVVAERLLDDDAAPGALLVRRVDQAGLAELLDDRREELGGDGQVEEPVAAGAVGARRAPRAAP